MNERDSGLSMIQNICHLIASREHGSLEKHVAELSRWQVHHMDARVSVIAHPRYRNMLDETVRFIPLNTDRSRHHPNLVWRLANHIRTGNFQIVHGHGSKSAQLLAAVQKYTDAYQVITRHNVRHPRDKLASAFDARIAVSHSAVANSKLSWNIIPNGLDTGPHAEPAVEIQLQGKSSLLTCARLTKANSLDALVHALEQLPQTELILLGEGPEKSNLEMLVKTLALEERVRILGHSEQVTAFMRATDLLVIPGRCEAIPNTLEAALLNRCPVLANRSGSAEDYVPEQYLLDSLAPEHLGAKLKQALADREQLQRDFAPVFDRAADELTLDRMATATWQVYTQLLQKPLRRYAD